jgi:predicted DNA-binding transcriptional regulator AlpA
MQTPAAASLPQSSELPRFITVAELAALCRLNKFTVYHWLKTAPERLPRVTRLHGRVLFLESDTRAWAGALHPEPAPAPAPTAAEALKRRRGRPTKMEQSVRQQAACSSAAATR